MMLGLLALLAGCGHRLPEQFADCSDSDCRQAWILDRWPKDRSAALAALDRLDPVERVAGVSALLEADPSSSQQLCDRLPAGSAQKHCIMIRNRPHLWLKGDKLKTRVVGARPGAVASSGDPVPSKELHSKYADVERVRVDCGDDFDEASCVTDKATALARVGSIASAVGVCEATGNTRGNDRIWRDECLFRVAEVVESARGLEATGIPPRFACSLETSREDA